MMTETVNDAAGMPDGTTSPYPDVRLKKGQSARLRRGHPWAFSNEVEMDDAARAISPGSIVSLIDAGDQRLGLATFNPHTLIAARVLTRDITLRIDEDFIENRLRLALAVRDAIFDAPSYRLVHAEADGFPGLIIDRFDDVLVAQPNTAGMTVLWEQILASLVKLLNPRAVVLRGDSAARSLEGLPEMVELVHGSLDGGVEVHEGGLRFALDPLTGQKTGWFHDQSENRAFAARLAKGRTVLDAYCHTGAFGLRAASAGATHVHLLDSSAPALELAEKSARENGLGEALTFTKGEAFRTLAALDAQGDRFGLVIVDPPSFAKSRRDIKGGLRAYRKLARLGARLVEPGGFLVIASCSHHASAEAFLEAVTKGLWDANRTARLLRAAGAGPDHPVHPALPESAYLKCLTFALD